MTIKKTVRQAVKKTLLKFGIDVRRVPRHRKSAQVFAERVIADSKLLSNRYRVELVRALGLTSDNDLTAWEEDCLHLSSPAQGGKKTDVLKNSDIPIILGPWLSEIGFELLYWIPLLRHWLNMHGISPRRVIALSRGGAASWYTGLAYRYLDAFDLCTPEEFCRGNEEREAELQGKKQFQWCGFEEKLIRKAASKLGLEQYACVHPSLMYQFFQTWWTGMAPLRTVTDHGDYSRLRGVYAPPPGVPFRDYAAVKFYHSDCFQRTRENVEFIRDCIAQLARTSNVVLLNTGLKLDDHDDAASKIDLPNVFDATPLMEPRTNLETQTAIVAHARRFYATYGGFSYLGPLLGVPTQSFYSTTNFVFEHLDVANRVFNRERQLFSVLATSDVQSLRNQSAVAAKDEPARAA